MEENLLLSNIRSIVPIADSEWQFISSFIVERHFKKGTIFHREGEVNRFTNFIESGSVRVFYIDLNGHEHVVQLGIRGWWIGDFASFITQKKGLSENLLIALLAGRRRYIHFHMKPYRPSTKKFRFLNDFTACL